MRTWYFADTLSTPAPADPGFHDWHQHRETMRHLVQLRQIDVESNRILVEWWNHIFKGREVGVFGYDKKALFQKWMKNLFLPQSRHARFGVGIWNSSYYMYMRFSFEQRCWAPTRRGVRCKNAVFAPQRYCHVHLRDHAENSASQLAAPIFKLPSSYAGQRRRRRRRRGGSAGKDLKTVIKE
jgi:hypothetical protein